MKVVMLEHLVADKEYKVGSKMTVSDLAAITMIEKGIAKAETPKAHKELMERADKVKKEEEDKQAKIIAIQREDELKVEAYSLLEDLVKVVNTIGTNDEGFKETFIEQLHIKLTEEVTTDDTALGPTEETGKEEK